MILADQFEEMVTVIEKMRLFGEVSEWLPIEEMEFDHRRFENTRITAPSGTDAMAHLRREEELAEDADSIRHLCSSAFPPHIKSYRDRIVEGKQDFEAVITADALDAATADSEAVEWVRDIAAAGNATVYRYNGPVDYQLGVFDDTATIVPLDDTGAPCAVLETDDDVICQWVNDQLAKYRSQATPLP